MRPSWRLRLVAVAAPLLVVAGLAPAAAGIASAPADVTELEVVFSVENTNRSQVPCAADGARYDVRARLVGPARALREPDHAAVTLYVHGLGLASSYWHFGAVPGYDHVAELAARGHVGLVYDRLGYGENPKPVGLETCYGSDADVAAQLAEQLRAGTYATPSGGRPVAFERVVAAAYSQAGLIVQPMAYSFPDAVDALVITSWTDEGNDTAVAAEAATTAQTCLAGGEGADDGPRPPFYAYYPRDDEAFQRLSFFDATDEVVAAATERRQPDPCGDGGSLPQTLATDQLRLQDITVPTLLVYGTEDAYRSQPEAGEAHAEQLSGVDDLTLQFLEGTGNALALERSAPQFRDRMADWLCARGLAGAAACGGPAGAATPPPGAEPSAAARPAPSSPTAPPLPVTGATPPLLAVAALLAGRALSRLRRRAAPPETAQPPACAGG